MEEAPGEAGKEEVPSPTVAFTLDTKRMVRRGQGNKDAGR